ncbi:hypothetical protein L1987_68843 [Smallanthus sonchifolius]|uniref:Uncharacterized protein n=1 Tax=Smallanthus sonchifolius TaxID=185202 RepID=A0ACB9B4F3_9ASTR|nr:hypothetical protein L1987_68843 [Smallanthus sonchifolius]
MELDLSSLPSVRKFAAEFFSSSLPSKICGTAARFVMIIAFEFAIGVFKRRLGVALLPWHGAPLQVIKELARKEDDWK